LENEIRVMKIEVCGESEYIQFDNKNVSLLFSEAYTKRTFMLYACRVQIILFHYGLNIKADFY
jgi:hypothetical protein